MSVVPYEDLTWNGESNAQFIGGHEPFTWYNKPIRCLYQQPTQFVETSI